MYLNPANPLQIDHSRKQSRSEPSKSYLPTQPLPLPLPLPLREFDPTTTQKLTLSRPGALLGARCSYKITVLEAKVKAKAKLHLKVNPEPKLKSKSMPALSSPYSPLLYSTLLFSASLFSAYPRVHRVRYGALLSYPSAHVSRYLPTYLPISLPTYLPIYLRTYPLTLEQARGLSQSPTSLVPCLTLSSLRIGDEAPSQSIDRLVCLPVRLSVGWSASQSLRQWVSRSISRFS